jgi:hypothetical protein
MSTHREIDRATAERLLSGGRAGPAHDRLARLLAAAAAPAMAGETDGGGEQAALVAFREAHPTGSPVPRRRSMLKLTVAKLLTAKVAALAAAATLAGGVALATTGNIPNPMSGLGASETAADRGNPDRGAPEQAADPMSHASPSPSIEGLCQAFLASTEVERGRALESPAFQVLIRTAGDEAEVDSYCADLVPGAGEQPEDAGPPTELPTPSDLPSSAHPTPGPGDQDGPPDERPGPPGDS